MTTTEPTTTATLAYSDGYDWNQDRYHSVVWYVDKMYTWAEFECSAPEGSFCRLTCAETCESETIPCYSYDSGDSERRYHALVDMGECRVILSLNEAYDPTETYDGLCERIRSGLIEVSPEDWGYSWRYPKDVPDPVNVVKSLRWMCERQAGTSHIHTDNQ